MDEMMNKKLSGREYRKILVEDLEARADDNGEKVVEGYATKFNTEYNLWSCHGYEVNEKIGPNAFAETDMSDVIMQYNHEGRVFARNRNNTLQLFVDEIGLKIRANLGGTELGRQLYEEIKGGYTDKMSFGFTVAEDKREETEDRENGKTTILRTITKIKKLYDVSAVSIPANDATEITARAYGEGVVAECREEIAKAEKRKKQRELIKLLCTV